MEGSLKAGMQLISTSGSVYTVERLLGAGGQGEVYSVMDGNRKYALKWYFPNMATKEQWQTIVHLIEIGKPDESFLWPTDLLKKDDGSTFGYIMDLRPKSFVGIVDLMKNKVDITFTNLLRATYKLVSGYQKLHKMGLSYRDISFGNVFFNPNNGDILICDNDNVSANGSEDSTVYGTPRFMAPEIVVGQAKPSRNTDLYSLAVLLFYMYMVNHPLDGALEASIKCLDASAMNKLYGTDPIFIFDPNDSSNRPLQGYHDMVSTYWQLYPSYLRETFITAFTQGIRQPGKRITEKQWLKVIGTMLMTITEHDCGAENFLDEEHGTHVCYHCGEIIQKPVSMKVQDHLLYLQHDKEIRSHYIFNDFDIDTIVAQVTQNPNNPAILGLKNLTNENWILLREDGSQTIVPPGRNALITAGNKVDFGSVTGEFI